MDKAAEQRTWSNVTERDHQIHKTGFKQGDLQHPGVSKEVPTSHSYGEIPQTLSAK